MVPRVCTQIYSKWKILEFKSLFRLNSYLFQNWNISNNTFSAKERERRIIYANELMQKTYVILENNKIIEFHDDTYESIVYPGRVASVAMWRAAFDREQ